MKDHTLILDGSFSNNGTPLIEEKGRMEVFGKGWSNTRFLVTFTALPQDSSGLMTGWYKNKIVPEMQNAYRELGNYFTLKETDLELRKLCPFMRVDVPVNDGWKLSRVIEFGEAGKNKQAEFINFIRILAATEFSVDIKDPGVKQTN